MAKGTVTDDLWRNEKTMRTDLAVVGLAAICWSWSNDNRTDGFVPGEVVLTLARGDKRLLKTAALRGWLEKEEGGAEPGYTIHNWDKGNRNRPPAWWDEYYGGKAESGSAGGKANDRSGGLAKARAALAAKRAESKQALSENTQAGLSTSLEKPSKQTKPVLPLLRTSSLENPTGVDVSLVGVTEPLVPSGAVEPILHWLVEHHKLDADKATIEDWLADNDEPEAEDVIAALDRAWKLGKGKDYSGKALLAYIVSTASANGAKGEGVSLLLRMQAGYLK